MPRQESMTLSSNLWSLALVAAIGLGNSLIAFGDQRLAVPTADKQKQISKVLAETYSLAKLDNAARKQEAVKTLMDATRDASLAADERYVILVTVIPLAKDVADFTNWLEATTKLLDSYDVDARSEKVRLLTDYLASTKTVPALKPAVDEAILTADQAAEGNHFPDALAVLTAAQSAVRRVTGASGLQKSLADAREAIATRETAWKVFEEASTKLKTDPNDPDANSSAGRWYVLQQDDWNAGLPFLVKGNDSAWKAAAELETSKANDANGLVAAADAWWEIAEKQSGPIKTALLLHVGGLYERAQPNVTSALTKQLITKRLATIAPLKSGGLQNAANGNQAASKKNAEGEIETGKWVELLDLVRLPDHVLLGNWKRKDEAVICDPSDDARFIIPVVVSGNYELKCEFTRRTGDDAVGLIIPIGSSTAYVILSGWRGKVHGLEVIDGRRAIDLPANIGATSKPGILINGQKQLLEIDVTQKGDKVATVVASLNGKRFANWTGRPAQLSTSAGASLPCPHAIGVNVFRSATDIHSVQLRVKRDSKAYRLGEDWVNSLHPVADSPPREIADKCLTWNDRKYFISDKPMNFVAAQRLATALQGRLLMLSSAEEEKFILNEGRGLFFWMAGWRRTDDTQWRDERNRPLRYIGKWCRGQPQSGYRELHLWLCSNPKELGVHDAEPWFGVAHACIEWGEEYSGN